MSEINPARPVDLSHFHIPSSEAKPSPSDSKETQDIQDSLEQLREGLADVLEKKRKLIEDILKDLSRTITKETAQGKKIDTQAILQRVEEAHGKIKEIISSMRGGLTPAQEHSVQASDATWHALEQELLKKYDAGDHAEAILHPSSSFSSARPPEEPPAAQSAGPPPPDLATFTAGLKGSEDEKISQLQKYASGPINDGIQKKYGPNASISNVNLYNSKLGEMCYAFSHAKNFHEADQIAQQIMLTLQQGQGTAPKKALEAAAPAAAAPATIGAIEDTIRNSPWSNTKLSGTWLNECAYLKSLSAEDSTGAVNRFVAWVNSLNWKSAYDTPQDPLKQMDLDSIQKISTLIGQTLKSSDTDQTIPASPPRLSDHLEYLPVVIYPPKGMAASDVNIQISNNHVVGNVGVLHYWDAMGNDCGENKPPTPNPMISWKLSDIKTTFTDPITKATGYVIYTNSDFISGGIWLSDNKLIADPSTNVNGQHLTHLELTNNPHAGQAAPPDTTFDSTCVDGINGMASLETCNTQTLNGKAFHYDIPGTGSDATASDTISSIKNDLSKLPDGDKWTKLVQTASSPDRTYILPPKSLCGAGQPMEQYYTQFLRDGLFGTHTNANIKDLKFAGVPTEGHPDVPTFTCSGVNLSADKNSVTLTFTDDLSHKTFHLTTNLTDMHTWFSGTPDTWKMTDENGNPTAMDPQATRVIYNLTAMVNYGIQPSDVRKDPKAVISGDWAVQHKDLFYQASKYNHYCQIATKYMNTYCFDNAEFAGGSNVLSYQTKNTPNAFHSIHMGAWTSTPQQPPTWQQEKDAINKWAGTDPNREYLANILVGDLTRACNGKWGEQADLTKFKGWFDDFVTQARKDPTTPYADIYYASPGLTDEGLKNLCDGLKLTPTNYTPPDFKPFDQAYASLYNYKSSQGAQNVVGALSTYLKSKDPQDSKNTKEVLANWANNNVFISSFWTRNPSISMDDATNIAKIVGATVPSQPTVPRTWQQEKQAIIDWAGSDPKKKPLADWLEKAITDAHGNHMSDPATLTEFKQWFDAFVKARSGGMKNPDIYYACPGLTGKKDGVDGTLDILCKQLQLTPANSNYSPPPFTINDQAFVTLSDFQPSTGDGIKVKEAVLAHLRGLDPQDPKNDASALTTWANANIFNSDFWKTYPNISIGDADAIAKAVGATVPSKPSPSPVNWDTLEKEANLLYRIRSTDVLELTNKTPQMISALRQKLNQEIGNNVPWSKIAQDFGFADKIPPDQYEMYARHLLAIYNSCLAQPPNQQAAEITNQRNAAAQAAGVFDNADKKLKELESNSGATWDDWITWTKTSGYQNLSTRPPFDDVAAFKKLLEKPQ